ncbi:MAG: hypothetical protein ABI377_01490 [Devosia sp.]
MTKSLSPLSFDRNRKDDGVGPDEITADPAAGAADDSPALPPAQIGAAADFATDKGDTDDMLHAVEEAMKEEDAKPVSGTVTPFPAPGSALARVTVVTNTASPAEMAAEVPPDESPEISGDMIEAIETDIASLLASLNRLDDAAPPEAPATDAAGDWLEEDEADEEPTLALLSELNRMWQADPVVSGEHA